MKTTSLISLTAALFLSTTPLSLAQTVDAGGDVTVDAGVDAEVDGDGVAVGAQTGVDANAEADASLLDEGEDDMSLDTDGDGIVSDEEAAAGGQASLTESCSATDIDLSMMTGADQAAEIAAATSARVVRLTDCEDDMTSALSAETQAAVSANTVIIGAIQRDGGSAGDILGIVVEGDTATVYLRANETDDADEAAMDAGLDAETDEADTDAGVTVTQ